MKKYGKLSEWGAQIIVDNIMSLTNTECYPAFMFVEIIQTQVGEDNYMTFEADEWVKTFFADIRDAMNDNILEDDDADIWKDTRKFQLLFCHYLFKQIFEQCYSYNAFKQTHWNTKTTLDEFTLASIKHELKTIFLEEDTKCKRKFFSQFQ